MTKLLSNIEIRKIVETVCATDEHTGLRRLWFKLIDAIEHSDYQSLKNTVNRATQNPENKIIDTIMVAGDWHRLTLLHYAAFWGDEKIAKELIELGSDTNALDKLKITPLHLAVIKRNNAVIKVLLSYQSTNPNLFDSQGFAPLHLTSLDGNIEATKLLIDAGAKVNLKHRLTYRTPFYYAIRGENQKVADLLQHSGASWIRRNIKHGNKAVKELGKWNFDLDYELYRYYEFFE